MAREASNRGGYRIMNIKRRKKRKPGSEGFMGCGRRPLWVLFLLLGILFVFSLHAMARILVKGNTIIFSLDFPHPEKNKQRIKKIVQVEKEIKYDKTKDPLVNKKLGVNPSAVDRLEGKKVAISKDKKIAVLLSYSCTQMVHAAENPWMCDATATVLDAEGYVLNKNTIKGNFLYIQVHNSIPYFVLFCHTCCDGPRMGGLFDLNGEKVCDISDHRDDSWINHTEYRCIGNTPEKIFYINLAARLIHDPAHMHENPGGKIIGTLPDKSKVHIIEERNDWVLVDNNFKKGWIHKKNLKKGFVSLIKKIDLPQDPIERLAVLLYDRDFNVKMMAAKALAKIGDKKALDILFKALEDKNPETRYSAVSALGNTKNHQIVTPLITTLKQENAPYVLTCGIRILGDFGDKNATKLLIDLLSHKEATVRWEAAYSLGKIKDPRSVNALIVSLKDDNQTVVTHAASALKRITNQDFGRDVNKWLKWWEENLK
jgi:hypothetical protein